MGRVRFAALCCVDFIEPVTMAARSELEDGHEA